MDSADPEGEEASFATPIFSGARFDEPGMPAAALSEIAAFDRIIRNIAKAVYTRNGARLPRGFNDRFELRLHDIRSTASKEAVLTRPRPAQLFTAGDAFDDAFREFVEITAAFAGQGTQAGVAAVFDKEVLAQFRPLGVSLNDGESIAFTDKKSGLTGVFNREVRRRVLAAADPDHVLQPATVIGTVRATQFDPTVELRIRTGRRVVTIECGGPVPPDVLHAVNESTTTVAVLARGEGTYTLDGILREVRDTQTIAVVPIRSGEALQVAPRSWTAAMRRMRGIRRGWLNGEGRPVDGATLDAVDSVIRAAHRFGAPFPLLSPSVEGGIMLDWVRPPWRVTGEVEPGSGTLELVAVTTTGPAPMFRSIRLDELRAPTEVALFVHYDEYGD